MKQFWKSAEASTTGTGHEILLDGKPLRTPARLPLVLPAAVLAQAIAAEWQAVEGEVAAGALPLTGLANAAIDIVQPDPPAFAESLARYAATDLTCYRADMPAALAARQALIWEPALKAVEERLGASFQRTSGVMHIEQSPETLDAVRGRLVALPCFELAALQPIVTIAGSVVLALAHLDGVLDARSAFAAAMLDEDWQTESWGADAETDAVRARRESEFLSAARFLALSRGLVAGA